jgi:hypothetical protein
LKEIFRTAPKARFQRRSDDALEALLAIGGTEERVDSLTVWQVHGYGFAAKLHLSLSLLWKQRESLAGKNFHNSVATAQAMWCLNLNRNQGSIPLRNNVTPAQAQGCADCHKAGQKV